MVSVDIVICQGCGAHLDPQPGADRVTCEYCGTTSLINKPREPPSRAPSRSRRGARRVVLGMLLLLAGATIGGGWLMSRARPPVLASSSIVSAAPSPADPSRDAEIAVE